MASSLLAIHNLLEAAAKEAITNANMNRTFGRLA